jgi:histidinol-phosphate aminotransferase
VATLASFEDLPLLQERVVAVRTERERLAEGLAQLPDFTVYPSRANFVLCHIEGVEARRLQTELMDRGIMVRYFETPLLQNHLRFSVGRPEQTDRLLAALREALVSVRAGH